MPPASHRVSRTACKTQFVPIRVRDVEVPFVPLCVPRRGIGRQPMGYRPGVERIYVLDVKDHSPPPARVPIGSAGNEAQVGRPHLEAGELHVLAAVAKLEA
jgi:hypothetical protein